MFVLADASAEPTNDFIQTRSSGADAVGVFATRQAAVKLVVTDLGMPIMDGRAMIAALHQIQPKLRIIAMTGTLSGETHEGTFATLGKPVTKQDLLVTVHDALK